ncbi:CAP domain protein [Metarhizium robertsii ARSEF 23]|uniref:CAP domain protein n=1 Tax=Metarhizium robertsii (strain ARSEF 23 / ATCC MYA-3075) TaxID=655844 RepID=E9F9R2_METRA|nr:CAP domain protein [Metarhizium robertsii ARSEF 23]EFY95555.1 CAP domain protein [Metarhizium robertsii ARSEF 23]
MRVPLLVAALPLVSALPRGLLDQRPADTVDPNRGRAADVSWNGQNDYFSSRGRDRHPSWQGKDRDPSWQGKDRDPSWQGKDNDPSWQGKDNDPSWNGPGWPEHPYRPDFPEENDKPEVNDQPEANDQPEVNNQPEVNDQAEVNDKSEVNNQPEDNNQQEDNDQQEDNNQQEGNDQQEDDCPAEDDGLADDNDQSEDDCPSEDNTSATTTSAPDKPVATQTEHVVSATPSPTEAPSGTNKDLYMPIVDKWLPALNLRPLKYDAELAKTALQCSELSNGDLKHCPHEGNAQIMAPGNETAFEHVFVGGWLGERSDLFPDQEVWRNFSKAWDYRGQTDHADYLADQGTYDNGKPLKLTKIGCGWAGGSNGGQQWNMWTCDLA